VCSGEAATIAALMQTLGDVPGRPELRRLGFFPQRDWDRLYVSCASRRLRAEGNWSPHHILRDGLTNVIHRCQGAA